GVAERVVGAEAAGRIWQDRVPRQTEITEEVTPVLVEEPLPTDGDGRYVTPARGQAVAHQVVGRVLPRPGEQAGSEGEFADPQRLVRGRFALLASADERDDLDPVAVGQ